MNGRKDENMSIGEKSPDGVRQTFPDWARLFSAAFKTRTFVKGDSQGSPERSDIFQIAIAENFKPEKVLNFR
jgi:hypothetical protein